MQQLQVSTQYQEQNFFFFEIKVAIAKVVPYAVFVGKRISEISSRVAIDIYRWLREVYSKLLQTQIILGGPGMVIQFDESLFRTQGRQETSAIIK